MTVNTVHQILTGNSDLYAYIDEGLHAFLYDTVEELVQDFGRYTSIMYHDSLNDWDDFLLEVQEELYV